MDNLGIYLRGLTTSVFTAVSLKIGGLGDLLCLFIAAVVLDYIMGVSAAVYNKKLSSGVGFRGIIKKVGAFAVIAVALIADEVVTQAIRNFGAVFSTGGMIATAVTVWLILNELISVLENLAEMEIPLPPFLLAAIKLLKEKAEQNAEDLQKKNKTRTK